MNFPPIWDASWMDWVQYNGSIQQPMGRNVGEALGVRSRINLLGYPGKQFQNTIHVDNLHEIEKLIGGDALGKGVRSPQWPEDILGKIDREKAARGRGSTTIYACTAISRRCSRTKAARTTAGRDASTKDRNSSRSPWFRSTRSEPIRTKRKISLSARRTPAR